MPRRREDLTWLAGLAEGEAWFGHVKNKNVMSSRMSIEMTDEDVVRRVHHVTGIGTVHSKDRSHEGYKTVWCWRACGQPARELMAELLPLMGERRSLRIREILSA